MEKLIEQFSLGLFFWQSVLFVALVLLLKKFAWKPILEAVNDREEGIKNALESAEEAKKEMQSFNILSLSAFNAFISSFAFSAVAKAVAIDSSRSCTIVKIGFQANFFKINRMIEKETIIQKINPIDGFTNSIVYKFYVFTFCKNCLQQPCRQFKFFLT